jgi:L-threonylcarbamoyladenylate synthase
MPVLKPTIKNIKLCSNIINHGDVVAFPTETVYGLGADVFNENAVIKIFEIKKRPRFDPLIVHISDISDIDKIAHKPPERIKKLFKKFWPGPLTVILKKKNSVPDVVTAGLDTVAVRMPSNSIAFQLIKTSKTPIAAPSANRFTRLSPTRAEHVLKQLGSNIFVLDGGKTVYGVESTIIKYERGNIYLLRPGALSPEKIEKEFGKKLLMPVAGKIESPGQFKKHYSPAKKLIIVRDEDEIKISEDAGYISFKDRPLKKYRFSAVLSEKGDLYEAASNLFDILNKAEDASIKKIYVQRVPLNGIGFAIMDRLKRAEGL